MRKMISILSLAVVLGAFALPATAKADTIITFVSGHPGRHYSYDRRDDRHHNYRHHQRHQYHARHYDYRPPAPTYRTHVVYQKPVVIARDPYYGRHERVIYR